MENTSGAKDNLVNDKVACENAVVTRENEAVPHENETADTEIVNHKYWGCVVVLASFFNIAIIDGVGYTAGILLDSLLAELGGGRGGVAVAGSLQVGVYSLSGPIVGRLISRCGARPVCMVGALISCLGLLGASFASSLGCVLLGYSVVAGFGFGMMYIPSVVGVAPYFTERRALAIGICLCGSGIGTFTLAPISAYLLEYYGWRWVFRTFSIICFFCIFCGASMVPVREEQQENSIKEQSFRNPDNEPRPGLRKQILTLILGEELTRSRSLGVFCLIVLADFLTFTAIYIPYTHLPPLAKFAGVSSGDAAFLISAGGISNTVGRFSGGWLSDQPWSHPLYLTLAAISAAAIPSFILPWCSQYWIFVLSFGFFGFVTGCEVGCTSPLLVKLLGLSCLTQAFGIMTALRGVAALVGPPTAGLLVDQFDDPGLALCLCGALMVASSVVAGIAAVLNRAVEKRASYVEL